MQFDPYMFETILGERSVVDLPKLSLNSREEAINFIYTYGYDLSNYKDSEVLWRNHRAAVEILEEEILDVDEELPGQVRNREELKDIASLLVIASIKDGGKLQKYACAILRVMHLITHLENDLFSSFTDDIQYQILRPIQEHIFKGDQDATFLGDNQEIPLVHFNVKPFKQTRSAVVKLLSRKRALAMTLLDRVGLRFVTENVFDIFRIIKYLIDHHLVSFPHVISSESKNMICPINVFLEASESLVQGKGGELDMTVFDKNLQEKIERWQSEGNSFEVQNEYSSNEFKFLKFISRRFLRIDRGSQKEPLNFFYPFEIQIVDRETFENNTSGGANHAAYKERQRRAARRRVLGFSDERVSN